MQSYYIFSREAFQFESEFKIGEQSADIFERFPLQQSVIVEPRHGIHECGRVEYGAPCERHVTGSVGTKAYGAGNNQSALAP